MARNIKFLYFAALVLTLSAVFFIHVNAELLGRIFWHLLTVHDFPAAWLMLGMLAVGYILAYRGGRSLVWLDRLPVDLYRRRYSLAGALWLILCGGSLWIYRAHPLSMDEYAAVFQAKVFAEGSMHGYFPPELMDQLIPLGFQNHFLMVNRSTGAVFSAYWPGFSLLLTPFEWLGAPWACNPTLTAAAFLVISRIVRDIGGEPAIAGWALLFSLASPAFVTNGIAFYSMPAHLLLNLVYAWLLLQPSPLRLFLAGLVGGYALSLHNPFPHAVFALPWIAWLALRRERRFADLGLVAMGYIPGIALLVIGWSYWQREMLSVTVNAVMSIASEASSAAPDFSDRLEKIIAGFLRQLRWPDELIAYARIGGLVKLWLWASPLLLLLAWWGGRCDQRSGVRLLGASALLTFFAYFLIRFDQGHGWGYRYFHSAWGSLPILGALGIARLRAPVLIVGNEHLRPILVMTLVSLVLGNGLRLEQTRKFIAEHLAQSPPRVEAESRVVLRNHRGYYGLDLVQNDPWLRGPEVVLLSEGKLAEATLSQYFPSAVEAGENRFGKAFVLNGQP